ncbi:hypothetical protein ADICYQ_4465 [Cyclobacterium qasimii M12-11B]|uniref:Uncharacterized protein n=1 Tax=Cyclobacterium qasimii M12-11B TaxID=641524 RepID=S7WR04_9BACT|nr:hypothetical protein ADICYQ_4465 [Cyclobacterium qasimii M12-11B]
MILDKNQIRNVISYRLIIKISELLITWFSFVNLIVGNSASTIPHYHLSM